MTESVLITGGTGFLGRFLGRRLRDAGKRVVLGARNVEQSRHAQEFSWCETKPLGVANIESVRDAVFQVLIGDGEIEYTREISIDDKKFYLIDFRDKKFGNVPHVISSENSRRLSDDEISRLLRDPDQEVQEQPNGG